MENLQLRLQLRATIQNTISEIMTTNNITATQMEDALSYVLMQIKDAAMSEYVNWAMQDKMLALEALQTPTEEVEEG